MINDKEYIKESIESNLIYCGSMLEFTYSLSFSFLAYNSDIINELNNYYEKFRKQLIKTISIANGNISKELLDSNILYTKYTIPVYKLGEELTSNKEDISIIESLMKLKPGIPKPTKELLEEVTIINKDTYSLLKEYNDFITYINAQVLNVNVLVYKYAMYIEDIINRGTYYMKSLKRIMNREKVSTILIDNNINNIKKLMERNALFINGFVNQSEEQIIKKARVFARDYQMLDLSNSNDYKEAYNLTDRFSIFITFLLQKLVDRNLQLMVGPAFLDICLREANDFKYNINIVLNQKEA